MGLSRTRFTPTAIPRTCSSAAIFRWCPARSSAVARSAFSRWRTTAAWDDKLIAVPAQKVDPFQKEINELTDLPERERDRIKHFFEHYKDLEEGKWVKVIGWGDRAEAEQILAKSVADFKG